MSSLVKFLRARLRDDESLAQVIIDGDHWHGIHVDTATEVAVHIERHDPARVLREVEAKREIVKRHYPVDPCDAHDASFETIDCDTLLLLALPYADHPDYREEWKP